MAPKLHVAIVGATGMVGSILVEQLEKRRFPVDKIFPFSSGKKNAAVRFRGRSILAPKPSLKALLASDLVFLVSSDEVAFRYGQILARRGVWIIDDSSAFRLHPDVPLVIPEVNAHSLSPNKRLIAGPNCTATGIAVAGYPIHRRAKILRIRMASYQAVSGAGKEALQELSFQTRSVLNDRDTPLNFGKGTVSSLCLKGKALPRPIAFNLFPQVGSFDDAGECREETKVREELRKLWAAPDLRVSATAVRVPIVRGHSLAAWIETERPLSASRIRNLLQRSSGIHLWKKGEYPTPLACAGTDPVHVGRIRSGTDSNKETALWIVSDNLLKGAALNSIQIAECLLARRWLRR